MKTDIDRILNELYDIDPSLRERGEELGRAAAELSDARPEADMDPAFERELRERLLASFPERRGVAALPGSATATGSTAGATGPRGRLRSMLASPAIRTGATALAACLVVVLFLRFGPLGDRRGEPVGSDLPALSAAPGAGGAAATLPEGGAATAQAGASGGALRADEAAAARPLPAQGRSEAAAGPAGELARAATSATASDALPDLEIAPSEEARPVASAPPPPAPEIAPQAAGTRAKSAKAAPLFGFVKKEMSAAADSEDRLAEAPLSRAAPASRTSPIAEGFNTEGYDAIAESSFAKTALEPLSTFSIDVDTASYSNVRRFIERGSLPPPDAVRIEELVNYFSYDYPEPEGGDPFAFSPELAYCPWNPEHLLLRLGLQAKRIPAEELPPSNLVFLIDVSGSMEDEAKLPLVKESLKLLARGMRIQDRIAIAVYAGAAGLVLPPTPGGEIKKIEAALDKLEAGGSTAGGEGIELAYEVAKASFMSQGNNRVIIATDGDFNVGASSDGELVRLIEKKRGEGIFLTVLGFGMGNYKDSKMQKLADSGNGNYAYVDSLSEAEKVLSRQLAGTLYAVAKDVKIQIEFNPAVVGEYRLVGYEKRVLAARDFADDTKDAGELGAGSSVTALYELVPSTGASPRTDLKYQSASPAPASASGELMTIKFRYKRPTADASVLRETPVTLEPKQFARASVDFRFAATVAEWGLLLRGSKYSGSASWKEVVSQASASRGRDEEGYRSEFLRLARLTETLAGRPR